MFSYTVGIPARNEENNILNCLESVYTQVILPERVIVCVNGSSDKTFEIVKQYSKDKHNLTLLTCEPGKMVAIKKIMKENFSDYLMFVDADTKVNKEASKELHFSLKTKKVLFAGGSSWRIKPKTNFFTKISDTVFEQVDRQLFLNGKMYMFNALELKSALEINSITEIPDNIISDGHFFEKVSEQSGGYYITDNAYSICYPVTNFKDWFRFRLRVSRGRKQLYKLYPRFFKDSDFLNHRVKNHIHRFLIASNFYKKTGSLLFPLVKELINIYVFYFEDSSFDKRWHVIESTKGKK